MRTKIIQASPTTLQAGNALIRGKERLSTVLLDYIIAVEIVIFNVLYLTHSFGFFPVSFLSKLKGPRSTE